MTLKQEAVRLLFAICSLMLVVMLTNQNQDLFSSDSLPTVGSTTQISDPAKVSALNKSKPHLNKMVANKPIHRQATRNLASGQIKKANLKTISKLATAGKKMRPVRIARSIEKNRFERNL